MSYDTPEEIRDWSELMDFGFPLLSDPDRRAGRIMEVDRDPGDRLYQLPRRITYLIDPEGVIRAAYLVGRDEIEAHPGEVLADLRRLTGQT